MKNNKVAQHNHLVEYQVASNALTLKAKKLYLGILSLIRQEDRDLIKEYVLPVIEFATIAGLDDKNPYNSLHKAAMELESTSISFTSLDGKARTHSKLVSSVTSIKGEGAVRVHLDHRLKSYLIDLKEQYTEFLLINALNLNNEHSIRLYEILKQYQKIGERKCTVDDLRAWMGLKNNYSRIFEFRSKVIEKAMEEINLKTDVHVEITETIKDGRIIKAWVFKIKKAPMVSSGADPGAEKKKIDLKPEQRDLLESLAAAQVKGTNLSSDDYLNACIEYAQTQTKPINHPAKYLQKCLLEDFPGLLKNKKDKSKKIPNQRVQKTGFHLPESRGKDYTNDELEKILLGRKKKQPTMR